MSKLAFIVGALVLVAIFFVVIRSPNVTRKESELKINQTVVKIEELTTVEDRIKGLSGRDNLPADEGLWFVYDIDGFPAMWMKDMKFAIDIVWVNKDLQIVHIVENATPESYPEVFTTSAPANYVLEVNSGFIKANSIKIGDKVEIF